ncbi:MAG: helix-turn-helix transcriptional regulator [Sandaracinaceae bacterium]|nr:helix-turn-helix transcriptional regulator [Sandaracinaceae bacterium]
MGIHMLRRNGSCTGVARMDGLLGVRYLVTVRHADSGVGGVTVANLSPRQHAIARLAAAGATARETARELGISPHTVRQHLKVAYRALGVSNRVELARAMDSDGAHPPIGDRSLSCPVR